MIDLFAPGHATKYVYLGGFHGNQWYLESTSVSVYWIERPEEKHGDPKPRSEMELYLIFINKRRAGCGTCVVIM